MSSRDEAPPAVAIRVLSSEDSAAILAFARTLPVDDLLFLARDIRNDKVVAAWIEQEGRGVIRSLVATAEGGLCGCAAVVRDAMSWSAHVAELRVVVAPHIRGAGVGRRLAQAAFALAVADGVEKIFVRIVPEQTRAIALFEEMGFRPEAMLCDHVRDADGVKHDIAVLSLDVLRQGAQHRAYGMG